MKENTVSMQIARRLAVFFLKHPLVANVELFGSIAMWGDGDDIDLILTITNDATAYAFLEALAQARKHCEETVEVQERYGVLKAMRHDLVFQSLGWQTRHQECDWVCWNDKWGQWDALFQQKRYLEAENLEVANYREPDLFLMPVAWQTSERVREMLPTWPSKRPFGAFSFYDVIRWQARQFNTQTNEFGPHVELGGEQEKTFREAKRREHISWTIQRKQVMLALEAKHQAN